MTKRNADSDSEPSHARSTSGTEAQSDSDKNHLWVGVLVDLAYAVVIVGAVVGIVFAVSGVWPPVVAVESGSMHPHIQTGDMVVVNSVSASLPTGTVHGTGVVTYQSGSRSGYSSFGESGNVIVYQSNVVHKKVIHRARFWVSQGENWYGKANPKYLNGASSCAALKYCPAPHSGFITKGDANPYYDQVAGISSPVRPSDVVAVATIRIPYLGYLRMWL